MKERIQSLFGILERDPGNVEAMTSLEEMVTGEEADRHREELIAELAAGWKRLLRAQRWAAGCAVIDLELALTDDRDREIALLREQTRLFDEELFEQKPALDRLKKLATLLPDDRSLAAKIEEVEAERSRWRELADKFIEQAAEATEPSLKAHLLYSAAERIYRNNKRGKDIVQTLRSALEADPLHNKAARLLEKVLLDREKWPELASLYVTLADRQPDRDARLQMLLSAAYTYAIRIEDKERAVEVYSEVLDLVPGHETALRFLAQYYESREDWDHLVALFEDALHGKPGPAEEAAMLLQIGMINWRMRNRMDAAEEAFKRLRRLDPAHPGMLSFFRQLYGAENGDKGKLLQVLSEAQRTAADGSLKDKLTKEVAQLSATLPAAQGGNAEKAIESFKAVLRREPDNREARDELKRLCRQSEKWNSLIEVLKGEVDSLPADDVVGRASVLREMVEVYRDHQRNDAMVVSTYNALLQLVPEDADALDALEQLYEQLKRWNDLVGLLRRRATASGDHEEKLRLLSREAALWIDQFKNLNKAVEPLEAILEIEPGNRYALETLRSVYTNRRAWKPLFDLVKKEASTLTGQEKRDKLVELARIASDRLNEHAQAIALWREALAIDSETPDALVTLEKLTEREKDWAGLAEVLELMVQAEPHPEEKVNLLSKLGTVLKERQQNPAGAAEAWRRVLELQPGHVKAIRALREAYLGAGDFASLEQLFVETGDYEGLVDVLGTAADRSDDPEHRKQLSFRCAEIYEQNISQPDRALRHYERVLAAEPSNERAARALVDIYRRAEKWHKLVEVVEVVLQHTDDETERLLLLDELKDVAAAKLSNRKLAFRFAAEAFAVNPRDLGVREAFEAAAAAAGTWDEAVQLYREKLADLAADDQLALERHLARLAIDRLGAVDDAIAGWRRILAQRPGDEEALNALDGIFRSAGRWNELIEIYELRLALTTDATARREQILDLARILEDVAEEPEKAAARYRSLVDEDPTDSEALTAIERLARNSGKFDELATVLAERRTLTGPETSEWKSLGLEMATIRWRELHDGEAAISLFEGVLDQHPGDADAIEAMQSLLTTEKFRLRVASLLEPHLSLAENWPKLAWVLAILIEAEADLDRRLVLQRRLAEVYGHQLSDPRAAFDVLGDALRAHPTDMTLWDELSALGDGLGLTQELADRFEAIWRRGDLTPEIEVALARRLADLLDTQLGRSADAEPYHRRVLAADPACQGSFTALETLFTTAERWNDLLELYHTAFDQQPSISDQLELQLKICFIVDEMLHDVEAAIAAYNVVLELDSANALAARALTVLYEEAQQYTELFAHLEAQLAGAVGDEAVAIQHRLGELAELHLDDPAEAVERYDAVLLSDPANLRAEEALERLLARPQLRQRVARILERVFVNQGAANPLARILDIELEDSDLTSADRISILMRLAELRERRLSDADGAFAAIAQAFALDPSDEILLDELSRIAGEFGLVDKEVVILEDALKKVSDDLALSARLLTTLARLYDERLGDFERSERAWQRLLDNDPTNPSTALVAVSALDRLLASREAWPELVAALRIKVEVLDDPVERVNVLHRMAEIEESVLERLPEAVRLYEEIVSYDDGEARALAGLERLHERLGRYPELVEVLRRRAALENSLDTRRDLLLRVATLVEEKLADSDDAIASYNRVNDEIGPDRTALAALARLYRARESWRDLLDVYELQEPLTEEGQPKAEILFLIGEILVTRLDEAERGVERLGEALAIDPHHAGARLALEEMLGSRVKLEAIRILRPLAEAEGDYDKLLRFCDVEANETDDPLERARVYQQAAEIAEVGLDDRRRAFDLLSRAFRDASSSPELERMIGHLESLAASVDGYRELLALYREVTPEILDGTLQNRCYARVAEIAHTIVGDLALAREYYVKVLDMDGEHLPSMDALELIYEAEEQWPELLEIYRRKALIVAHDDQRRGILFNQARLCETKLEDLSGAVAIYEAMLDANPDDRDAMAALERLYPAVERWSDFMALIERRIELEPSRAVELLVRLGEVADTRLGDEDRALGYYSRALDEDPNHRETLVALEAMMADEGRRGRVAEILEPVYKLRGDWPKLADALTARLETCDDPMTRQELLRQIGSLHEEQLGDLETAFDFFAKLFVEDLENRSSWDILSRLASVLEAWGRLATVWSTALDGVVGDTPITAELAFQLGEIYESRLGNPGEAKRWYRRVLAFAPDDPRAFSAVERMLLATDSWSELVALYRDAADAALDPHARKSFLFKMAEVHESAADDFESAIDAYRGVLEIDDRDARAISALDRLYYQTKRHEDLALHLRNQIEQEEGTSRRSALRLRLAKVQEEQLHDVTAAVDVYEEALNEGGCPEAVVELERLILVEEQRHRIAELLEPIYRAADEWRKLVVILDTQLAFIDTPADRVGKLREIAWLQESRGGNLELAFRALAKGYADAPNEREIIAELVRLAQSLDNWDVLANTIQAGVEDIYDMELKAEVLHLIGTVFDQRLDLPRRAIDAYRAVLTIDETDGRALDALEGLYNLVGEWTGLVEVLSAKADLATEPSARAEILRAKASIQEDLMSLPAEAIESYRAALEADPTTLVTMDALDRLFQAAASWSDLVDIRRRRLEVVTDQAERLEISRSIARLFEEKLNDTYEAISAWRAAMEVDPTDRESMAALDRLYCREGMHPELLEILRTLREQSRDEAERIIVGIRIGSLLENDLADARGAIEAFRDVLTQSPANGEAIAALTRIAQDEGVRLEALAVLEPLHRDAARYDKLTELLELKLAVLNEPQERLHELLSLAEIHETGRSDPRAAFSVLARALAEDPSRVEVMDGLERIAGAEHLWRELDGIYEERIDAAYEPSLERELALRLGRLREAWLTDEPRAIEAYRRALDAGGVDQQVLPALDRLYERRAAWTELDEIIEREIALAEDAAQIAALKLRQGTIREREFGDVPGAIQAFRDVAEADPTHDDVVAALERLLVRDEFVEDVVAVLLPVYNARDDRFRIGALYAHRLRVAPSVEDQVRLLSELAAHHEIALGDPNAAFDAWARAFALAPAEERTLSELERLSDDLGSWAALVDVVDKVLADPALEKQLATEYGLKVANWAATRLGDPRKAEALYRGVLERESDNLEALAALESLLRQLGRFEDLLPVMASRAEVTFDEAQKREIFISMARIAQYELGDARRAIAAWRRTLELNEADLDALDALIRLTDTTADHVARTELLLARARQTGDPKESNQFRHQAAAALIGPLGKPDQAIDVYREILEYDGDDANAAIELARVYEQLGRFADLKDLLVDMQSRAATEFDRLTLVRRIAELVEARFDAVDEAIGYWQEILLGTPEDEHAQAALERLLLKAERFADLVEVLEGRADRARSANDLAGELGLLVRIGELWDGKLSDPDRATSIYERVLERDPEHTRALAALARLYEANADWERCAEVLRRAASAGRGGADEAEVHFRLAKLAESRLDDQEQAVSELRRAVALDPAHLDANRALARFARQRGDWNELVEALMREEAHLSETPLRIERLLEIAELQATRAGDSAGAVASLERARAVDPQNKDVLVRLGDAYVAAGRGDEAIPVLEALIDAETEGGKKRPKPVAILYQRLAKAYLARGDLGKAAENLELAYKIDLTNVEVLISLGRLAYDTSDLEKASKLFRSLLLQKFEASAGASKADIYWYLGDIALKQGDAKKAKGMFQRGLDEDGSHAGCKSGLAQC